MLRKEHEADVEDYKKKEALVKELVLQYNRTPLGALEMSKTFITKGKQKITKLIASIKERLKSDSSI